MPYSGASDSIEDFLTKRANEKRQAMLDQITVQKEERLKQHDAADLEIKRETLDALRANRTQTQADKAAKLAQDLSDKDLKNFTTKMDRAGVGEVIDPGTIAQGARHGITVPVKQTPPEVIPAGQSAPMLPTGGPEPTDPNMATVPERPAQLPGAQPPIALKMAPTYAGSKKDQEDAAKKQRVQALMDSLPEGSPERKAAEFYLATGVQLPAGGFDPKGQKSPELGTFGDQLIRISGGHPETLTSAQVEAARKKWGDEGRTTPREPSPQPQIFVGADGKTHAIQFSGGQAREIPMPDGLHKGTAGGARPLPYQAASNVAAMNTAEVEGVKVLKGLHQVGLDTSNDPADPRWEKFVVTTLKVAPSDFTKADIQQRTAYVQAALLRQLMGGRPTQYIAQMIQQHLPEGSMSGMQLSHVLSNVLEQVGEQRGELKTMLPGVVEPSTGQTYKQYLAELMGSHGGASGGGSGIKSVTEIK